MIKNISITGSIIYYIHYLTPLKRIFIYFILILLLGATKEYFFDEYEDRLSPEVREYIFDRFRTSKHSFINVYFVKLGWMWTFIALIPYFIIIRFIYVLNQNGSEIKHLKITKDKEQNYETVSQPAPENSSDEEVKEEKKLSTNARFRTFLVEYIRELIKPAIRLSLATIFWYFSVESFVDIAKWTGHCQSKDNSKLNICL